MEFLGKGSCFGEVAIMNSSKMKAAGIPNDVILRRVARMADIRALERCELLELRFADAWPLIKEIPALWSKLEGIRSLACLFIQLAMCTRLHAEGARLQAEVPPPPTCLGTRRRMWHVTAKPSAADAPHSMCPYMMCSKMRSGKIAVRKNKESSDSSPSKHA